MKRITAYFAFLLFLLTLSAMMASIPQTVFAQQSQSQQQQIENIDFSHINVDNLTDQQIVAIIKKAQSRGMSISDLENLASARGMPASEVQKFQQRVMQIQSKGGLTSQNAAVDTTALNRMPINFRELLSRRTVPFQQNQQNMLAAPGSTAASQQRKIFGADLFNQKKLTFAPSMNIPTPKDYQLGPGDEIMINIWGAAQMTYQETISPDGSISISNIGPIYLNGLTMDQARKRIIKRLTEIYSGLSPNNPKKRNTYADITLGKIRSINVNIIGEVQAPGTYTLSSLSTVFNALYVCGGPNDNGSYRSIEVIRNNKVIDSVDVYDFLVYGKTASNIRLQDQDIIKVDPYRKRVYVGGEVKRPRLFQVKQGETLSDVFRFAGGFTDSAYTKRVKVIRNTSTEKKILSVNDSQFKTFKLRNGDQIFVGKILDRFANRAEIKGAVFRPGAYQVTDTTTVYNLIKVAEGLRGDAYMTRALIYRTMPDYEIKVIPFSLQDLMKDPADNDIKLQKDDIVVISSIFDMRQKYNVKIYGAVQDTGSYPYAKNMTLKDLIMQANGFKESAAPYRMEVSRRMTRTPKDTVISQIAQIFSFSVDRQLHIEKGGEKFILKPFDEVFVRSEPNYQAQQQASAVGEVLYPGQYTIASKNETISDLIKRAGGLTPQAYPQGARLIRKSREGQSGPIGINLPQILAHPGSKYDLQLMPGDELRIPKKLETVKVSGAVLYPINVPYSKSLGFRDYIDRAGGYADSAAWKRSYVMYPNGEIQKINKVLFFRHYPKVEPGSQIFVPTKPKTQGLTAQERLGIISAIVSMTATLATTVAILSRYL